MHKQLRCPCCDTRIIDVDKKIEAAVAAVKSPTVADFYIKCKKCKNEIGIIKIK